MSLLAAVFRIVERCVAPITDPSDPRAPVKTASLGAFRMRNEGRRSPVDDVPGSADSPAPRRGGVQSHRAFALLELVAAQGGSMSLSEVATASGLAAGHAPPAGRARWSTSATCARSRRGATPSVRGCSCWPRAPDLLDHVAPTPPRRTSSRSSARPPTSRCWTATGSPTSRRRRDGTRCGCSPRSAAACSRTAPQSARRCSPPSHREDVGPCSRRTGLPRHTPHTVTDPDDLLGAARPSRGAGYALDEGEQEVGVRCVAVAVPGSTLRLALSVSGPAPRMTDELVAHAVPLLRRAPRRSPSAPDGPPRPPRRRRPRTPGHGRRLRRSGRRTRRAVRGPSAPRARPRAHGRARAH